MIEPVAHDPHIEPDSPQALGRILALFVVSDASVHPAELETLQELDAFARIGLTRAGFLAEVQRAQKSLWRTRPRVRSPFALPDTQRVDQALDAVQDADKRLLVARLAAAIVTADGRVEGLERLVYDHMLLRWGISPSRVAQAIREDRIAA